MWNAIIERGGIFSPLFIKWGRAYVDSGLEYRDRKVSVRNTMQRESVMRVVQAGYASAYSCWKERFDFPSFGSID
jgi:hypothetical protein